MPKTKTVSSCMAQIGQANNGLLEISCTTPGHSQQRLPRIGTCDPSEEGVTSSRAPITLQTIQGSRCEVTPTRVKPELCETRDSDIRDPRLETVFKKPGTRPRRDPGRDRDETSKNQCLFKAQTKIKAQIPLNFNQQQNIPSARYSRPSLSEDHPKSDRKVSAESRHFTRDRDPRLSLGQNPQKPETRDPRLETCTALVPM
uniref:Uncharacterized protein n=1 Tax=Steinernema glaseri TaxID=37863 RepID=A0A1I8A4M2_9BILA